MCFDLHFYSTKILQLTYIHLHKTVILLIHLDPYQEFAPLLHDLRTYSVLTARNGSFSKS